MSKLLISICFLLFTESIYSNTNDNRITTKKNYQEKPFYQYNFIVSNIGTNFNSFKKILKSIFNTKKINFNQHNSSFTVMSKEYFDEAELIEKLIQQKLNIVGNITRVKIKSINEHNNNKSF